MDMQDVEVKAIRFSVKKLGVEVGHAYLYLLVNELHKELFGFTEDVFVHEAHRGEGVGDELMAALIARAKEERCYKLIATSRSDRTREKVHDWYLRLGFKDYGVEFRFDFTSYP